MSKSDLLPIEAAVQNQVEQYFASSGSLKFILGVSGGMDSMSLLYSFKRLKLSALVVHVNYQKRGKSSDKDAELVEKLSLEWGFNCQTVTVDPAESGGQNFQQWARDTRYDIFRSLAREYHADGIAVAHHQDDQIETILQKIFRGAGLTSWTAMDVWDGEIFRPFLDISRAQIEKYVDEKSITYRTDKSNLESDFARNFLRNEWLSKLKEHFPGWKQNVLRVNEQAGNYEKALSWITQQVADEHGINRTKFHTLDKSVQKALVLYMLKQQEANVDVSRDSLQQLDELDQLQTGKALQLTEKFSLLRDREYYSIIENETSAFTPVTITIKKLKKSSIEKGSLRFSVVSYDQPDFNNGLYLDTEKIAWPVTLRRWKSGDKFQPLGMEGHQQVADHLTNRKVSAAHKNEALVLESFEERICAVIFPPIKNQSQIGSIAEHVKCDAKTKHCLKIQYSI